MLAFAEQGGRGPTCAANAANAGGPSEPQFERTNRRSNTGRPARRAFVSPAHRCFCAQQTGKRRGSAAFLSIAPPRRLARLAGRSGLRRSKASPTPAAGLCPRRHQFAHSHHWQAFFRRPITGRAASVSPPPLSLSLFHPVCTASRSSHANVTDVASFRIFSGSLPSRIDVALQAFSSLSHPPLDCDDDTHRIQDSGRRPTSPLSLYICPSP